MKNYGKMAGKAGSKGGKGPKMKQGNGASYGDFTDRNLAKVSPVQEQFEPTEGEPVRQHARMAGCR